MMAFVSAGGTDARTVSVQSATDYSYSEQDCEDRDLEDQDYDSEDSEDEEEEDLKKEHKLLHLLGSTAILTSLSIVSYLLLILMFQDAGWTPWWAVVLEVVNFVILFLAIFVTLHILCVQEDCYGKDCIDFIQSCFARSSWLGPVLMLFVASGVSVSSFIFTMLYMMPETCKFYDPDEVGSNLTASKDINATAIMSFTHMDCSNQRFRFLLSLCAHFSVIVLLYGVYGVYLVNPSMETFAAEIAFDFLDFQDFAFVLLDDEVINTYWGRADWGNDWLWWALMCVCGIAFISLVAQFLAAYFLMHRRTVASSPSRVAQFLAAYFPCRVNLRRDLTPMERCSRLVSVFLIELPFLVFRLLVAGKFDLPVSLLVFKNLLSIPKECAEFVSGQEIPLEILKGALEGDASLTVEPLGNA